MKKILFAFILLSNYAFSQDAIKTKEGEIIYCKITSFDSGFIIYENKSGSDKIRASNVAFYSKDGNIVNLEARSDSTPSVIKYKNKIEEAGVNLKSFHGQYVGGVTTQIIGGVVSYTGVIICISGVTSVNLSRVNGGAIFAGIGGVIGFIGRIIEIDAHKHIKKAGVSLSDAGLKYTF